MYDIMFVLILFGSIFLHEFGHAWGRLIQGIPVTRIMLYGGDQLSPPPRGTNKS